MPKIILEELNFMQKIIKIHMWHFTEKSKKGSWKELRSKLALQI